MKILIVDDNEKNLYMLETLLKSCSYDVVSAANGVEALANLREGEIDLIISDILMPQMDGFQLCRECKKDNKLKDIPFVFYTSTYTDDKDEEFAMKLGIDRFIHKPEEPDKFIKIIQDVIANTVSGKIEPQKAISEEEKEIFKLYSERLVNKLEKKMLDLETEVSERKKYEAKVTHLNLVLRAIRSVNQLIIREKDPEKLIRQACMNLIATRGYSFAWIVLLDENNKLKTAAEAGLGKKFTLLTEQMKKGRLNECTKRALKYTGVVLINETEKNCGDCPLSGVKLENSVMTIRLEHEDKIYGVLSVSVLKDFSTESEEQSLFEEIAEDIGFALHNIELEEMRKEAEKELHRINRARKAISECNQALIHAENEENLLNDICRIIVDFGGYRLTWIGYAEKDEQKTVRPVAQAGYEDGYLDTVNISWADTKRGRGPTGTAIRTGKPGIAKNILTDPKFAPWRAEAIKRGYESAMILPLISGDKTFGALNIYADEPDVFDKEEIKLLTELADDMAYGITSLRTRAKHKQAEEALKSSEERLQILFESAPDAYYLNDLKGIFIDGNKAAEDLLGYKKEELIGKSFLKLKLLSAKELIRASKLLVKNIQGKGTGPDEFIMNRKDGSRIPVEINTYPVKIKGKTVVLGIARDITERKQTEEKIRQLSQAVEQSPTSVMITDIQGNIEYSNPKFTELTGYSFDEVKGRNLNILRSGEKSTEEYKELWDTITKGEIWRGEFQNKKKNGELFWEDSTFGPIKNEKGKITHFIAMKADITAQKRLEEDQKILIHDREERLKELKCLYGLADSISKRTYIEEVFQDVANLIPPGWHYPDITRGRVLFDGKEYVSADFKESNLKQSSKIIVNGKTHGSVEVYYIEERPELDEEPFLKEERNLINSLAINLGKAIERMWVEEELRKERASLSRRVEERTAELSKANAELAKAAKMKDEFLASMSHELRTPLNAVLGLSEALQEEVYGEMNKKQHKSLRSIEESGRHLLALINDILDIAKIEAGKVSLELNQVPIEVVCQASLRLVKQTALKKNLQLTYNNKTSLLTFGADERRLKQILVNLLSNAVKFTPEGGEVGIEVTDDAEKEKINFMVWDTGIGIARESMDKLFQPFVQIDSSLTREYSGTGLGLSLVKHLTELHGGCVTVESKPGEGSHFTITLPVETKTVVPALKVEEGDDETGQVETGKDQEVIEGKALILLAEDNEKSIEMLSDYLVAKGYNLMIARNGKEAVKVAKERTPDLILIDIQMPVMDGLEATRIIRNDKDTNLAKVPVIALTALAMPGDKEKCLAAGANGYLKKPVGLKYLVKKIEEILRT